MAAQWEPRLLEEHAALRDFRAWKELTKEPYRVAPEVSLLCAPPPELLHPGELVARGEGHLIRVYANPQAQSLMRSPRGPRFPAGSRIAKVKLRPGSDQPESVAFMVKREAGYDAASLDWEFLFFQGSPLRRSTGDLSACRNCHSGLKEGDGVFGSYLPERRGGS